ncbi:tetratricopeptide repeat protein 28-like [Dendronephthya gigantea]|uniref:tetratricopeptide repeat protein 28-like n=1 Tax=Dendronephthya gigantea TaxID=151771 RepID=UPI00106A3235|nr:tetratricopeptide repeat protein 28-like [Dendronephthya gigantea]
MLRLMTVIGDKKGIADAKMSLGRFSNPALEAQNSIDVGNAYVNLGHYDQAIDCFRNSLQIATAIGNQYGIARANMYLGDVYKRLKDYEKAISYLIESLKISTTIGNTYLMAESNRQLGNIYYSLGKGEIAISHWKKALELGTAIDNQGIIAKVNHSLSYTYVQLGRNDEALLCLEEALRLMTAIDDQKGIADANMSLGRFYQRTKDYKKAISFWKVSLEISTAISDQPSMAEQNRNLGDLYRCIEKWESAIDHYKKTLELGKPMGDQEKIADVNCNLGNCYSKLESNEEAVQCFEEMLRLMTAIGDQKGIAHANMYLGDVYERLKDYEKAISCLKESLEITTTIGDTYLMAESNRQLANNYYSLGKWEIAINHWKKTLKLGTAIGNQGIIAKANHTLSYSYIELGRNDEALSCLEEALRLMTAIDDQKGIAGVNMSLGRFYQRTKDYEMAISYLKVSLEISTAISDQSSMAEQNRNLGDLYRCKKKWESAIDHYKKTLEMGKAMSDQGETVNVKCNLGICYIKLKRNEDALQCFEETLRIFTAIGDKKGIAESNSRLGHIYSFFSEYEKAFAYLNRALNIYNAIDDQDGIKYVSNELGRVHQHKGEYSKAIEWHRKSLEIANTVSDKKGIVEANYDLSSIYQRIGENEKASSYIKDSFKIAMAIGNQSLIAKYYFYSGNIEFKFKKWDKAIDHYEKASKIFIAEGDQTAIITINGNLGTCYRELGMYDKALNYHKESLELAKTTGMRSGIAEANRDMGIIYRLLGDSEKAIEYGTKSLEISTIIGEPFMKIRSCEELANVYKSLGEYKLASSYLVKLIKILEEQFQNKVPDENKLSFTTFFCRAHGELMSCFVSLGRIESGLLVTDLGRAKELHFSIERKQNYFDAQLSHYAQSIWSKIEKSEENREIERIQNILQVKNDEISIVLFAFDFNEGSLKVWVLNSDVTFKCLHASNIWAFVMNFSARRGVNVNRDSSFFKLDSLAKEHTFESPMISPPTKPCKREKPEGWLEKHSSADNCSDENSLKKLFDFLIQPIRDAVKGNKLIVVPHGPLFFVPFSSLIDENRKYLSQSYSIQITPSLHTLTFTKEQPHESDLGFALFVGNPKVGKVSLHGEAVTPADLPKAAEEVISLSKLFTARPLVNAEAKKQVVLRLLSGASIIHIAAHGERKRGEIMLAPDPSLNEPSSSLPKEDSYLLTQQDITSISLQARLVVLCCCYTGKGELSPEGVIGVARSFLAAGARSVLATLWPISDDATKEFMEAFYGELLQETPVCEALRRVMNLFQQHEREDYRSFLIWAPFTLFGHDVMFTKGDIKTIREKSSRTLPEGGFALFVGNPKVGKVSLHGTDFTPTDLPKAAEEVASLSKLFTARPLVKAEAKKQVVLGLLSGASIIHVAAHGEPKKGEILLAPSNEPSSSHQNPDSFLLTQNDIRSTSLRARLVVLCCCYTGEGEISSEGVIGVARSFLAAGARSVLARLWPISDDATKEFMEALYGELLQETPVCEALRRVMSLFQQHEREDYRSFLIWAPFTIFGHDVMFTKGEIKTIREKSSETLPECGFALFVGNPTSDLPKATVEVNCLSKLFKAKAFVEGEAKKQVLLGLLTGASIIHISAHIEAQQCGIMLSPCVSSSVEDDILTQKDIQGLYMKSSLVVLCLCHSEQDEISPECVESLALSFLAAGARSVLTTLRHSDDDATTEFIKAFYNHLLHESSVREALEKTKKLFEKHDKEAYRSFVIRAPFTLYGEDVMFQKHDIETIKEKSHKMFSGFVVLPPLDELTGSFQKTPLDELTGSFENLDVQNRS